MANETDKATARPWQADSEYITDSEGNPVLRMDDEAKEGDQPLVLQAARAALEAAKP